MLVHSTRGRHLVRVPLASLEERLNPQEFIRAHRAAIVNLREVKELDQRDGAWLVARHVRRSTGARQPVAKATGAGAPLTEDAVASSGRAPRCRLMSSPTSRAGTIPPCESADQYRDALGT